MENSDLQNAPWLNVVVLHWEDGAALVRCLDNLARSDYLKLRVLAIENGSSILERRLATRAVSEASHRFGWLRLLQNEKNLGYADGNNAGVNFFNEEGLDGDICILNPDVAVGSKTLSMMMAARTPGVGLVMSSAVTQQGKKLYDYFTLSGYFQKRATTRVKVVETDYAQGACFIINRSLIGNALFDRRFFLYWEEVDLSLRVRESGYKVISCTDAPITRAENSLSRLPNALYYSARNGWLLKTKHPAAFSAAGYCSYLISLAMLTVKLTARPRSFASAWKLLAIALIDARAGRYGQRRAESYAPVQVHSLGGKWVL